MTALAEVPARRIIAAIADAAARWADADFPPRVRLLDRIARRTGYTLPVVEYALDRLFASMEIDALEATIADELGSIDALDTFIERSGRPRARALPAGRVCVVSSRTTIGVALVPAIFALCAKCDVLVKDREDGLVRAFFSSLAEEHDAFEAGARAEHWASESGAVDLGAFDVVAAFGNDATLAHIRSRLAPRARIEGFGSRASAGYVTREHLADADGVARIAAGVARDLVLYETEGCLSLHALFVERGGVLDPADLGANVAREIERANIEFPAGERDAAATAQLAHARNMAAFRAATGNGSVFSDERASFLVVVDPPLADPPAFLPRAIAIHPVDGPGDALAYLQRHALPLEALALAGERADLAAFARATGANRVAAFGELQHPPLGGNHGGRPRIEPFVRWMTDER